MGFILRYTMRLVINSLRDTHIHVHTHAHMCTHTHTHTHTHTCKQKTQTKAILRNQVYTHLVLKVVYTGYLTLCMGGSKAIAGQYSYVTGFWFCKTDWIVTLGLSHFIGPANGYTCTLHIQSAITRVGWLVCLSRTSFADTVYSWLR